MAKELTTTISLEGKVSGSLKKAFDEAAGLGKKTEGKLNAVLGKFGSFAKAAAGIAVTGFAAAGAAAVTASKKMFDLGSSFQEASNTIRIGTGATGEALEALNDSFNTVYKSVPTTMEAASQAVADYNTRLGLTGSALEELSGQAIQVSNLLGDDLTSVIEESSQAFQQWGIDVEDMGEAMDYVFKASQSTGVGFTELMQSAQKFGPQMQELGFSFKESTALLGQLDKAGVNADEVMGALKKSVGAFAKEGLSASEGLETYITKIKEAGSASEATAVAAEVFGAKAGSTMASAIRNGTLSVTELVAELEAADETIAKAAADTETFPQKMQKLQATAEVALRPVADKFLDIANDALPAVSNGIERIVPVISDSMGRLAPVLDNIASVAIPAISSGIETLTPLAMGLLPALQDGLGEMGSFLGGGEMTEKAAGIMEGIMKTAESAKPVLEGIGRTMGAIFTPLSRSVLPMMKAALESVVTRVRLFGEAASRLFPHISGLTNSLMPAFGATAEALSGIFSNMARVFTENILPGLESFGSALVGYAETVISAWEPVADKISGFIQRIMPLVGPALQSWHSLLGALFQNVLVPIGNWLVGAFANYVANTVTLVWGAITSIMSAVEPILPGIIKVFTGIMDFIRGVFTSDWRTAWEGIKTIFTGYWDAMKTVVRGFLTAIVKGLNSVISGLNSTVGAAGELIGIKTKIPNIPLPAFATGGTVTSPTLAVVGEGGAAETIIPHTNTAESRRLLAVAATGVLGTGATITGGSNDSRTFNITYSPVIQGAGLTEKDLRDDYERFRRFMDTYFADKDREAFA